ncbi:hypothetical protein [Flavobacterium chungnamense]|jgi:hypothetical protein|uniref:Uncharacterized protein n=1 Tax=Flavobacterium chungnamense TaxID=706182 RepID=A0ABP7UTS8_9FLAO
MQSTVNIIIGLLCFILGILIIMLYNIEKKEKKQGLYFSRFKNAGILLIMLGFTLIIREISK